MLAESKLSSDGCAGPSPPGVPQAKLRRTLVTEPPRNEQRGLSAPSLIQTSSVYRIAVRCQTEVWHRKLIRQ